MLRGSHRDVSSMACQPGRNRVGPVLGQMLLQGGVPAARRWWFNRDIPPVAPAARSPRAALDVIRRGPPRDRVPSSTRNPF
jgi:hypothetical protein